ncbi:hypothetical protein GYA49_02300 [Candidatus Beckwithbacteria bacterium]|nr:hypothetical protein [Candidatus Beckwithbacteria bacterium]
MKFIIKTFGCRLNIAESTEIARQLQEQGFSLAKNEIPDLVIVNTCAVTARAEQQIRQYVRKAKKLYPKAFIVACGCWVDN